MTGRIGHLHTHYRLLGQPDPLPDALRKRLDRLAVERLAPVVADALDQVFAGEDTVYVLRQVTVPLSLNYREDMPETQLAQRWGQQLSGRIVRSIAADPGDGQNLRQFDNQAHFVARFITDLLNGHAWEAWYYGAFQSLRAPSTSQTVYQVLVANKAEIPATLRYLAQAGALDQLLTDLSPQHKSLLWQQGLDAAPLLDAAALHPLWQTACHLLSQLDLWAESAPAQESLWPLYLAAHPLAADWREKRALAAAVLSIIHFLGDRGHLKSPPTDRIAYQIQMDQALSGMDWLDTAWLKRNLGHGFNSDDDPLPGSHRSRRGATPRQRALLRDLLALLPHQATKLNKGRLDSAANALRLYTALVVHSANWAGDPLATAMIARILQQTSFLAELDVSSASLAFLRQGDMNGAMAMTPSANQAQTAVLFDQLLSLGSDAIDIVVALLPAAAPQKPKKIDPLPGEVRPISSLHDMWLPTDYAGLFLLLRACSDLRLPALVRQAGWPGESAIAPLAALLAALGQRLAGGTDGEFDPGLALWAGVDILPADLAAAWPSSAPGDELRWQSTLLEALAGLRLLQPDQLLLYELVVNGRPALFGADASGMVWPFASLLTDGQTIGKISDEWQSLWLEATGHEPAMITATSVVQEDKLRAIYERGGTALQAAFAALEGGRLSLPQTDLTIALLSMALLRVWGRWLRQFASSSPAYLLQQFIRRSGTIKVSDDGLQVAFDSRPLDMIMDMAGYTAPLEHLSWLPYRQVTFHVGDSQ